MPAFSGKQKKLQLQDKRKRKKEKTQQQDDDSNSNEAEVEVVAPAAAQAEPAQQDTTLGGDKQGVRSIFQKESQKEVDRRRQSNYQRLSNRDFTPGIPFGRWFEMPCDTQSARIPVSFKLPSRAHMAPLLALGKPPIELHDEGAEGSDNRQQGAAANALDAAKHEFSLWLARIDQWASEQKEQSMQLNQFERNFAVWRQLWLTVEESDVIFIVVDARYPIFHLPLSILHLVINDYHKPCAVILNKVDLVAKEVLDRWKEFFTHYLALNGFSNIEFLEFSCKPNVESVTAEVTSSTVQRRKKKKRGDRAFETMQRGSSSEEEYDETVNFKGMEKATKELNVGRHQHAELPIVAQLVSKIIEAGKRLSKVPAGTPKIGFVGHPNVGKSSLINNLFGSKVVSESATAGHTKHLQTMPAPQHGVTLVDCPGLAVPVAGVPRPLQAVMGTHQIAQTRDPQSAVGYLGLHLPLEQIYGLKKQYDDPDTEWSPYEFCESYAVKRCYFVKHGKGVPDIHRAAIELLTEACEGRLVLYFAPPPLSAATLVPMLLS